MLIITVACAGCKCTAVSNFEWAGHFPPKINSPDDLIDHLRHRANGRTKFKGEAGSFTVAFKRIGIFGWRDFGYDGEITGEVEKTTLSSDKFYTVDMKLKTIQISDKKVEFTDSDKVYLRAEVCLCDVLFAKDQMPKVGNIVWMRGRMVWDGDGFPEIHPRNNTEVEILALRPQ